MACPAAWRGFWMTRWGRPTAASWRRRRPRRGRKVAAVAGLPGREAAPDEDPDSTGQVFRSQSLAFVDAVAAFPGVRGVAVGLEAVPAPSRADLRTLQAHCRRAHLLLCGLAPGPVPELPVPVDILAVRVTSPPGRDAGGYVRQRSAGGDRAEEGVILDLRALAAGGVGDVRAALAAIRVRGVRHVLLDDYPVIAGPPWGDATVRAMVCSELLPLGRRVDVRRLVDLPLEEVARLMAYAWWQYKSGRVDDDRRRIEGDYTYVLPYARFLRRAAAEALAGEVGAKEIIDGFFAQRTELVRYLWDSETAQSG